MLPASTPRKPAARRVIAAALALGLALPAAPALALDRHEQGIVAGALGLLFIQGMIQASQTQPQAAPAPQVPQHPAPQLVSASRTPAASAFSSYSAGERRAIQRSLARHGYYYGAIDGSFGRGTYNATAAYARDTWAASAMSTQAGAFGVYDQLLYAAR